MTPRSCHGSAALRLAPPVRRRVGAIAGLVESTPRGVQISPGVLDAVEATATQPAPPRPLPVEVADADRQAARHQRRIEMERELCEKLGLPEVAEQTAQARPRSAGLAPKRPPKPKPHRSVAPQAVAVPQRAEELPKVRRWKSAFMPLWLDVAPEKSPEPQCDLAKTAPAAMSADCEAVDEAETGGPAETEGPSLWTPEEPTEEPPVTTATVAPAPPLRREAPLPPAADMSSSPRVTACAETRQGARLLEENTRRMRENLQRLRFENRRYRVRPHDGVEHSEVLGEGEGTPFQLESRKKFEDLRRKIAALEESTDAERQRLKMEQQEAEERRRAQEAFERKLQEQVERDLREHREREAQEAAEQSAREDEVRQALAERCQRRREQQLQEEERSRQLEEQRQGVAQGRWQDLEEELERHWAEQEAEERRRLDDYARDRRRQFEEWERCLAAERQRYATEAEFCAAARRQEARTAAQADEQFYAPQREAAPGPWPSTASASATPSPPSGSPVRGVSGRLGPQERALLKELQSVQMAPREIQKAKVKDLLLRWHPDKNPGCPEKAKELFQFVQQQRQAVLGL